MSFFDDADAAFDVFFDETLTVTPQDGSQYSIVVSVFQDLTDEPLTDEALETDEQSMNFIVKNTYVALVQNIKRGDSLRTTIGKVYIVSDVQKDNVVGFLIKARLKNDISPNNNRVRR